MYSNTAISQIIMLYGLIHAVIDAACGAIIFSLYGYTKIHSSHFILLVVLYNVLAFALQPIAGYFIDKLEYPVTTAAFGCLLTAVSTILYNWPFVAICFAGIGNALFHIGGGIVCMNLKPGKASLAGLYVAPGTLGLMAGALLGKSGHNTAWLFIVLLIVSMIILTIRKDYKPAIVSPIDIDTSHFELILIMLLTSITIRALIGLIIDFPWKSNILLLVGITMAVFLGKAMGGILADRFGFTKTAVLSLATAAPLLAFMADLPYAAIIGVFLFNLTMPVTLTAVASMFPHQKGFAFGLTTLFLMIGSLPAFTKLKNTLNGKMTVLVIVLISAFLLFWGLKLLNNGKGSMKMTSKSQAL